MGAAAAATGYSVQRSTSFNDLSREAGKEVLTRMRPDSGVPDGARAVGRNLAQGHAGPAQDADQERVEDGALGQDQRLSGRGQTGHRDENRGRAGQIRQEDARIADGGEGALVDVDPDGQEQESQRRDHDEGADHRP